MRIPSYNFQSFSNASSRHHSLAAHFYSQDRVFFGGIPLQQQALRALEKENVQGFNKIKQRLDKQKTPLDLSGYDFSGKMLPGIDLSGLNLTGAIFTNGTDLTNAKLRKALLLRIVTDNSTTWTGTPFDSTLPINGPSLKTLIQKYNFEVEDHCLVGYRTNGSVKGGFTYELGKNYKSDLFSRDKQSRHHGLWFYPSTDIVRRLHPGEPIIKVLVPYGDSNKTNLVKGDLDFRAPELTVSDFLGEN
ncbi:MAG TPA: pentapeptide repeat-containing protein [Coleofasciculaceae cyanobacterium]|jgi:hypothetical protein